MRALLPLLGLVTLDAARPDTYVAIREAVAEVAELAGAQDFDAARSRLDEEEALIAVVGEPSWSERWWGDPPATAEERALLTHARGVLEMQAGELAAAASALEQARALGGPGVIRLDSTYDLGVLFLEEGERYRAQIPELSGGGPAPAPPAADGEEPIDPLEAARAHYLQAREWFVERLILDWRDADTRANAELVQRRLRELDEIERQRQEQQEQQEPKDGEEPQEGDEEGEESSDEDQDPGEDSPENAEGEREPEEPEGEEGSEEEEPESDEAEESDPQEVHLTQEEMQRLLEELRQIEEEGEEVLEALRRIGRQNVDRDW